MAKNINIDATKREVLIELNLPTTQASKLEALLLKLQIQEIKDEVRRHEPALFPAGLPWHITHRVIPSTYGTIPEVPEEVISAWERDVKSKEARDFQKLQQGADVLFKDAKVRAIALLSQAEEQKDPAARAALLREVADIYAAQGLTWNELSALERASSDLENLPITTEFARIESRKFDIYLEAGQAQFVARNLQQLIERANGVLAEAELHRLRRSFILALARAGLVADSRRELDVYIRGWGSDDLGDISGFVSELAVYYFVIGASDEVSILSDRVTKRYGVIARPETLDSLDTYVHAFQRGTLDSHGSPEQALLTRSQMARLLWLAGFDEEAKSILEEALDDNHSVIEQACLKWSLVRTLSPVNAEFVDTHRDANDLAAISDSLSTDSEALNRAYRHLLVGSPREALPLLLREAAEGFQSLSWERTEHAHGALAELFLQLGEIAGATYHSIQSLNKDVVKKVLEASVGVSDRGLADAIAESAMASSLKAHLPHALKMLTVITPLCSDHTLAQVAKFGLAHARDEFEVFGNRGSSKESWDLLTVIAPWLASEEVESIRLRLMAVELRSTDIRLRKSILECATALVQRLDDGGKEQILAKVISLLDVRDPVSYPEVVRLIATLGSKSGDHLKAMAKDALFPRDEPIDMVRLDYAKQLAQPIPTDKAEPLMRKVIDTLKLTFQRSIGDVQEAPPHSFKVQSADPIDPAVTITSFGVPNNIVSVALDLLPQVSIALQQEFADALCTLAFEPENLFSNRKISFFGLLRMLERGVELDWAGIRTQVTPIARGECLSDRQLQMFLESQNPMNPFQFNSGDPRRLQGLALALVLGTSGAGFKEGSGILNKLLSSNKSTEVLAALDAAGHVVEPGDILISRLCLLLTSNDDGTAFAAVRALYRLRRVLSTEQIAFITTGIDELSRSNHFCRRRWAKDLAEAYLTSQPRTKKDRSWRCNQDRLRQIFERPDADRRVQP